MNVMLLSGTAYTCTSKYIHFTTILLNSRRTLFPLRWLHILADSSRTGKETRNKNPHQDTLCEQPLFSESKRYMYMWVWHNVLDTCHYIPCKFEHFTVMQLQNKQTFLCVCRSSSTIKVTKVQPNSTWNFLICAESNSLVYMHNTCTVYALWPLCPI